LLKLDVTAIPTAHDDQSPRVSIMTPDDHPHHDHPHPVEDPFDHSDHDHLVHSDQDRFTHLDQDHLGVDHGQVMIDIGPMITRPSPIPDYPPGIRARRVTPAR
jgi:hypothetical protein